MNEERQSLNSQYRIIGSWGNNTTIPMEEKVLIASLAPESPYQELDRMRLAGEQSMHYACQELGLVPPGKTWMDFVGGIHLEPPAAKWQLGLDEQYINRKGKLSKSPRNMRNVIGRNSR